MTRFYLIRHGETEWNAGQQRYSGRTDIELSEHGRQQAIQAAELLKEARYNRVIASTLTRAKQTAEPIAAIHGLKMQTDERLVEADFGQWEGLYAHVIHKEYADQWQAWVADPSDVRAGGTGETRAEIADRMTRFLQEAAVEYAEERIVVVSHSTAIRLTVASILGMPLHHFRRLNLNNTGITIIDAGSKGGFTVVQFNGGLTELYR
ncbi:histidine phosphatase family protein [Paenibacillus silviterrae]|uniref:histidine phosphatase family protein n=1 Tax=Paenibacillus silviterrae TaxID=3242194 RepID=UPI002542C9DA|nr:histidine phosphatase family protein [Paenibacillus chinjuensis]